MLPAVIIGSVVLLGMFFIVRQRNGDITPDEARQLVSDGAILVDVRSPEEYATGHLPDAINAPVQQLGTHVSNIEKRAKDHPVIVYCLSGARSAMAKRMLAAELKGPVRNLGAMSRW